MSNEFSKLDLSKVRQLAPFKIDYSKVKNLEYKDVNKTLPLTFKAYKAIEPKVAPIAIEEVPRQTFPDDLRYLQSYSSVQFPKGQVLVMVSASVHTAVKKALDVYVADLAYEGYFAVVYKVTSGKPSELRDFIKSKTPLAGVLMVGKLPVAWFEMSDDFDGGSSEFPCDLYYMDLDGTWNDPDGDGKFSEHPANVKPEIWVGRIWTPTKNGNDSTLINDYFARNHKFRKGQLGCSDRALAFVDDDWTNFDDCALDQMLPPSNIDTIRDPATTDGDRYKAEVNQHRAWMHLCAHSSPGGHSFKAPTGDEWVPNAYLRDQNPPNAFFYNLFACSNARFTDAEYMGGWYIFDKKGGSTSSGIAALGSTKTGSMLMFENFYAPMARGRNIGESYLDWWNALGASHDLGARQWYYGLTLLGDPTVNWWHAVVPTLRAPHDGDSFDHYPRLTHFSWDPIGLPNVFYNIEIDAHGARNGRGWSAESGQTLIVSGNLVVPRYEHLFVGAQRGRWRVRALVNNRTCPWTDWSYFDFKV